MVAASIALELLLLCLYYYYLYHPYHGYICQLLASPEIRILNISCPFFMLSVIPLLI